MKSYFHFFPASSAVMSVVAGFFVMSCSSDSNFEDPQPQKESTIVHFKAQIGAKGGEGAQEKAKAMRRSVADPNDGTLDAEWQTEEKIALIYGGSVHEATVTNVSSVGTATIEADLTDSPSDGEDVKLVYPLDAADASTENGIKADYLKRGQDGTLATISSKYDVATGDGTLAVSGATCSLSEMVKVSNQYAICKFGFRQGGSSITGVTVLVILDNSTGTCLYTVSGSEADGSVYAAIDPSITGVKRFLVFTMSANYSCSAAPSLQASKFYRPTLSVIQGEGGGAVDLGLSDGTIWATCNVGASVPEEYGDYFAWGDPEPYYSSLNPIVWKDGKSAGYVYSSYRWCNGTFNVMTKYCSNSEYGIVDNKTVLDAEDDAATVNWGNLWKMPTRSQILMLRFGGSITEWGTLNSVNGRFFYKKDASGNKVIDKYIFLPAAGQLGDGDIEVFYNEGTQGYYWGCENNATYCRLGTELFINATTVFPDTSNRMFGKTVRAVLAL